MIPYAVYLILAMNTIIQFVKKAFRLDGWQVRIVAIPIAVIFAVIWNNAFLNWDAFSVFLLALALWIIPSGFFDIVKGTLTKFLEILDALRSK